jgi:hypothetical protein
MCQSTEKRKIGRKKTSIGWRDCSWSTRALKNSAKTCGITWNLRVLQRKMLVCSRWSLVESFHHSFTANCTEMSGSFCSVQNSVKSCLDQSEAWTHAHFKQKHTRIPCVATQFCRMRVCFDCDQILPLKSGKVFLLSLFYGVNLAPKTL